MTDHIQLGEAEGWRMRVAHLRGARRTDDAYRLHERGFGPRGKVRVTLDDAAPGTRAELLRFRLTLDLARLDARSASATERRGAHATTEALAAEIIRGRARDDLGRDHRIILADIALALSAMGDETGAIEISSYLLGMSASVLETDNIAEAATALAAVRIGRRRIQLNNIAQRAARLAFLHHLSLPVLDGAARRAGLQRERTQLRIASNASALSTRARTTAAVRTQLVGRATALAVAVEHAVVLPDPHERARRLDEINRTGRELLRDSRELPEVSETQWLARAARLGNVFVEQAKVASTLGRADEAVAAAQLGRICLAPSLAKYERDADDLPQNSVRYADACWMLGDERAATDLWERTAERWETHGTEPRMAAAQELRARARRGIPGL